MLTRRSRNRLVPLVALSVLLSTLAMIAANAAPASAGSLAVAPVQATRPLTATLAGDDDVIVVAAPTPDGYVLDVAGSSEDWRMRRLAVLRTDSADTRAWTGYHCLTADRQAVVAVVAPWEAANIPARRDRGAAAFHVSLATGKVTTLATDVALKHFNPSCGTGGVTLVRHLGVDSAASDVLVFGNDATYRTVHHLAGQVIGATASDGTLYVLRDRSVSTVSASSVETTVAELDGQPFMPAALRDGGIAYLVATDSSTRLDTLRDGRRSTITTTALGDTKLYPGADGQPIAAVRGTTTATSDAVRIVRARTAPSMPSAVSSRGSVQLGSAELASGALVDRLVATDDGALVWQRNQDAIDMTIPHPSSIFGSLDSTSSTSSTSSSGGDASPSSGFTIMSGNVTTPTCSVPRNDPRIMTPQSNEAQVKWAIEQAVAQNTSFSRPADFLKQGWATYQPVGDFPAPNLSGPTTRVPASVAWATFVQESNWKQASRRALAGAGANPTIASYYGAPFNDPLSTIDYDKADCGYGIAQVTDGMRKTDGTRTETQQKKIALDVVANAAAGVVVLAQKWNQLLGMSPAIVANNGDAKYLENWYFALWAYNTGVNAADADGNYGLGWTNNPRNGDYPPDRQPFLRTNLDDSRTPSNWPYQERVFGWMENPLWQAGNTSNRYYSRPQNNALLKYPGYNDFCSTINQCNPTTETTFQDGSKSYCTRSDRHCWWHWSHTWVDCTVAGNCALSVAPTVTNTEPASSNNWPPNCSTLPTGADPATAVVIDDIPDGTPNNEGCANTVSAGTFTPTFGSDANGAPLAEIDWHQLGTGYRGHTWFTDNVSPSQTALTVAGRWKPNGIYGTYKVYAHIPPAGARSQDAQYTVNNGFGLYRVTIDQSRYQSNKWAELGEFFFAGGDAYVELTNANDEASGTTTLAFDAMAFLPQPTGNRQRTTLVPTGATWRYLDNGTTPSGWAQSSFDASSWKSGAATLGAGATALTTTINRTAPAHVTDYFRRTFSVADRTKVQALEFTYRYDDAIAVWLNGTMVLNENLPGASAPSPTTLASSDVTSPAQDQYFTRELSAFGLQDGTNTIAVELHQSSSSSPDAVFDFGLTALTAPAPRDFAITRAYENGQNEVAALAIQWKAVQDADWYNIYKIDWDAGPNAVADIEEVVYAYSAEPDPNGVITASLGGGGRKVHADYWITAVVDGAESLPSTVHRVWIVANVEDEADGSGHDIFYGAFRSTPQAPARQVPTRAPQPVVETPPEVLPESGAPNGGPGWVGVAVLVGELVRQYYQRTAPDLSSRADLTDLTLPTDYSQSTPVTNSEVDALAAKYALRPMASPMTEQERKTVARECLASQMRVVAGPQACERLSIFIPGADNWDATDHYQKSIASNPTWIVLTRDIPSEQKELTVSRSWYRSFEPCKSAPTGDGLDCDEYPFYASAQGGRMPSSLDLVIASQNRSIGSHLRNFFALCSVPFAVSPTPFALNGGPFAVLPTQKMPVTNYICGSSV